MSNLKYFEEHEFKMGQEPVFDRMSAWFLRNLDQLRENCGFPLIISSSFRTTQHHGKIYQKLCQPAPMKSMHLKGRAVDIKTEHLTGEQRVKLMQEALALKFSVGVYKTIFHIDDRRNQTIFGNKL
ncbi:MAG: hypothetical protein GY804_06750 [Alphaproteobacteria bacterium]|nr:hypothetical protein [Alphaproteobacteria bacterium]